MSVQVSYSKQTIFGLIFIFLLLFFLEISINVYDYFTKTCKYEKNADAYANFSDELISFLIVLLKFKPLFVLNYLSFYQTMYFDYYDLFLLLLYFPYLNHYHQK